MKGATHKRGPFVCLTNVGLLAQQEVEVVAGLYLVGLLAIVEDTHRTRADEV